MDDLSEKSIIVNCPHCHLDSNAFNYILEKTKNFYIVCDTNPLTEGHILIIPKEHLSCVGAYSSLLYNEFLILNKTVIRFLLNEYGKVSSFEHGKFGQTVFHSHVHYVPFNGLPSDIVPEGKEKLTRLNDFSELKKLYDKEGGYLFFSIGNHMWSVDKGIAAPRFFRDRNAAVFDKPERGNWKTMSVNKNIMEQAKKDDLMTQRKWKKFQ